MRKQRDLLPIILCLFVIVCYFSFLFFTLTKAVRREANNIKSHEIEQAIQSHFKTKLIPEAKSKLAKNGIKPETFLKPVTMKITGYAPLDPKAVKGMCYSGNPNVTASGRKTMPGVTIAAGRDLPFGTNVYIPELGWRVVEDRGGAIKSNVLDVCFHTRKEAFEWGVRTCKVYVLYPAKEN